MTETTTKALSGDEVISRYFAAVYKWMTIAIALTAAVAWKISSNEAALMYLIKNQILFWGLIIAQFGAVIYLAVRVRKMSFGAALAVFLGYAALTGVTFSVVLAAYSGAIISKAFVATAGMYGAMAIYGYTTKRDLSPWGSFLFMSLIGIVLGSFLNMWLHSNYLDFMVTYGGIVIFAGLTAYDHQKLKAFALAGATGSMVVHGALTLYLDFINLFLLLLRVFDRR